MDIEELMSSAEPSAMLDTAVAFLTNLLRDAPCLTDDVMKQAAAQGISVRTLRRARAMLPIIVDHPGGATNIWQWRWQEAA